MAEKENTFLTANNIYEDVEGESGKVLDLEFSQRVNLVGIVKEICLETNLRSGSPT